MTDRVARVENAKRILHQAGQEREWEHYDDPTPILDQLVPYATIIADAEGHVDITAILEEYLEL